MLGDTVLRQPLTGLYNIWLAANVSAAELARLREETGVSRVITNIMSEMLVPRLESSEIASASKERYLAESRFIVDVQTRFYTRMASHLRDALGVGVPITGTADHGHSSSSYPMLMSPAKVDAVDGHVYWRHPPAFPRALPLTHAMRTASLDGAGKPNGAPIVARRTADGWHCRSVHQSRRGISCRWTGGSARSLAKRARPVHRAPLPSAVQGRIFRICSRFPR